MTLPFPAPSPLALRLFGPFEVRLNGVPLPRLRSRKGQSLLALLVLRQGAEVERDWLAGLLWPEGSTSQGRALLRRDLTDLRRALGAEAGRLRSPTQHSLCLELAGAPVDVPVFYGPMAPGGPLSLGPEPGGVRGPLLAGWTGERWVARRESRRPRELR